MTVTRRLNKKAIWGYVIGFFAVFDVVLAFLAWEDVRGIYFTAGYNHASPLSIVGRSQQETLMVGQCQRR